MLDGLEKEKEKKESQVCREGSGSGKSLMRDDEYAKNTWYKILNN